MGLDYLPMTAVFAAGVAVGFQISRYFKNSLMAMNVKKKLKGSAKLVLVVRNDLKMGKGKVAAQCAHAAVMACQYAFNHEPDILYLWHSQGQPKIVLKVETEEELLKLKLFAKQRGIITSLVKDAGHTQVQPGSKTVLGLGPALEKDLDGITGHLRLY